jgi:alginate O-acetyltransferase complex protein AlgI
MLFTSQVFFYLLATTFILYYLPIAKRLQVHILVAASLFFYGWSSPWLLLLLAISIGLNAVTSSLAMEADLRRARAWLTAGVVVNLTILGFFKYAGLIAGTLHLQGSVGDFLLKIPLPIGISFFTFEGISLCVDAFRGRDLAEVRAALRGRTRSYWLSTTLFVSFFPHLIAGPILKARHFFPQIRPKDLSGVDWEGAFRKLVVGYFLKMVVADNLRSFTGYMHAPFYQYKSSVELVVMLFAFSMQIFADFAGYSLIAIGLAKLFGYDLPDNFDFPYIAESFSEFWRRWHISLSSWLREYLYFPLGGNRVGAARTYLNLFIVMFLGGLWHGAAWSYAVWGTAHGVALAFERYLGLPERSKRTLVRVLRILIVFGYVTLAWLLFVLTDIREAADYLASIWRNRDRCVTCAAQPLAYMLIYSLPVIAYHLAYLTRQKLPAAFRRLAPVADPVCLGVMLFMTVTNFGGREAFIYFQF